MRRLMGLAWNEPASLLDYLPDVTTVVIDERRQGLAHGQLWLDHAIEHHKEMAIEVGLSEQDRDLLWPGVLIATLLLPMAWQKCLMGSILQNFSRRTTTQTPSISPVGPFLLTQSIRQAR
jgi:hypothetical protein